LQIWRRSEGRFGFPILDSNNKKKQRILIGMLIPIFLLPIFRTTKFSNKNSTPTKKVVIVKNRATATPIFLVINPLLLIVALIPYRSSKTYIMLAKCQTMLIYTNPMKIAIPILYNP
jgi:hypothetical protein